MATRGGDASPGARARLPKDRHAAGLLRGRLGGASGRTAHAPRPTRSARRSAPISEICDEIPGRRLRPTCGPPRRRTPEPRGRALTLVPAPRSGPRTGGTRASPPRARGRVRVATHERRPSRRSRDGRNCHKLHRSRRERARRAAAERKGRGGAKGGGWSKGEGERGAASGSEPPGDRAALPSRVERGSTRRSKQRPRAFPFLSGCPAAAFFFPLPRLSQRPNPDSFAPPPPSPLPVPAFFLLCALPLRQTSRPPDERPLPVRGDTLGAPLPTALSETAGSGGKAGGSGGMLGGGGKKKGPAQKSAGTSARRESGAGRVGVDAAKKGCGIGKGQIRYRADRNGGQRTEKRAWKSRKKWQRSRGRLTWRKKARAVAAIGCA